MRGAEGVVALGDGPILFTGKPPLLTGEVDLVNPSDDHLKVRALATAAGGPAVGDVRVATRLAPGAARRVRARLRLDRHTPAGRYETEVESGGRRVPAVVHVLERDSVRMQPDPVTLRGVAGETVAVTMVVANLGNVAHAVPSAGSVHVGERDWLGRAMVFALRDVGPDDGYQAFLDRLLHEGRTTLPAPMRLTFGSDAAELAPGATAEVALEATLPEGLVKGRSYVGRTTFLGATLGFEIDCLGTARTAKRRAR